MTRYVEDSVNPGGLQAGMHAYAGYFNGPFANLTAIRKDFPGKPVIGIATRLGGSKGADAIDLEPDTCGSTQAANFAACLSWLRQGYAGQFRLPLIYTMASWQARLERYLANQGVPRKKYFLWSSHVGLGQHYCSPSRCGFGLSAADATQYLFAQAYDRSCFQDYLFMPGTPPAGPAVPPVVQVSDTGDAVRMAQLRLIAWGYLPASSADGDFGSHTEAAVIAFQQAHGLSPDGIVGPLTWAALNAPPPAVKPPAPVPAPPYQYAAPFGLKVAIGRTSFKATWLPPAHTGQPDPEFQLFAYKGQAKAANLVPTYPRATDGVQYQGGSLERGTAYILHVVAGTGDHAKPFTYAEQAFRTA